VIADIQDDAGASAAGALGESAAHAHADVTVESGIAELVTAAVTRFGRLDIMVNNAGAQGDPAPVTELTAEGFDSTLAVFLAGDLSRYVTGAVIPVDGGATATTLGTVATDVGAAAEECTRTTTGAPGSPVVDRVPS
jgi:NAD(P)-dependent dehydrogenase (short-subunit alcohol dehydrogenase family)